MEPIFLSINWYIFQLVEKCQFTTSSFTQTQVLVDASKGMIQTFEYTTKRHINTNTKDLHDLGRKQGAWFFLLVSTHFFSSFSSFSLFFSYFAFDFNGAFFWWWWCGGGAIAPSPPRSAPVHDVFEFSLCLSYLYLIPFVPKKQQNDILILSVYMH